MITDAEKMRLKKLFSDTISLLCRSGLPGACAHRVDALVGITLDNQEVVLVNFSENFWQENECAVRTEVIDEKNAETQSSLTPEHPRTLGAGSYTVKDEYNAVRDDYGAGQELYNASEPVPDGGCGNGINLNDSSHDPVEHMGLQYTMSANQDRSGVDSLLPESVDRASVSESDSDCLLIKTEMRDDAAELNGAPTEAENFIASSADAVALSSVPAVHRSSYGSLSSRMKHIHNMQRHARRDSFGYKFCRPQQRYNSAADPSQVSCTNNGCILWLSFQDISVHLQTARDSTQILNGA